jgi:hypothetical protein
MTLRRASPWRYRRTFNQFATDEDADETTQGSLEGTAGSERTDTADDLQAE